MHVLAENIQIIIHTYITVNEQVDFRCAASAFSSLLFDVHMRGAKVGRAMQRLQLILLCCMLYGLQSACLELSPQAAVKAHSCTGLAHGTRSIPRRCQLALARRTTKSHSPKRELGRWILVPVICGFDRCCRQV